MCRSTVQPAHDCTSSIESPEEFSARAISRQGARVSRMKTASSNYCAVRKANDHPAFDCRPRLDGLGAGRKGSS